MFAHGVNPTEHPSINSITSDLECSYNNIVAVVILHNKSFHYYYNSMGINYKSSCSSTVYQTTALQLLHKYIVHLSVIQCCVG